MAKTQLLFTAGWEVLDGDYLILSLSLSLSLSNGVGRTAAFIAIDMGVEQARTQGTIDMPSIVVDMRQQRMKMIQSLVSRTWYSEIKFASCWGERRKVL